MRRAKKAALALGLGASLGAGALATGSIIESGASAPNEGRSTPSLDVSALKSSTQSEPVTPYGIFKRKRFKPEDAIYDTDTGTWKAAMTDRDTGITHTWGSYSTPGEAVTEASTQADYGNSKNSVMSGADCSWFIIC